MPENPGNFPESVTLSSDTIATQQRDAMIRDFYGRICMRLDLEPAAGSNLRLEASTLDLLDLRLTRGVVGPMSWQRTDGLMSDANDDIVISWMAGGYRFDRSGKETVEIAPGAACILPMDRRWRAETSNGEWTFCLQMPRALLRPFVEGIDDARPNAIAPDTPAGRLLLDYVAAVSRTPPTSSLRPIISQHIPDLLAISIGASPEMQHIAAGRGLRAARLRALKQHIDQHLADSRLSAETAGRSLNLSPRYIRRLFAADGTSFSDYVTEQRLKRFHRRLRSPAWAGTPIADIAFAVGLVEPSTFYRRFKARFGVTPSDVRAGAYDLRQTATLIVPHVYEEVRL